jgi:hypothetical protein
MVAADAVLLLERLALGCGCGGVFCFVGVFEDISFFANSVCAYVSPAIAIRLKRLGVANLCGLVASGIN